MLSTMTETSTTKTLFVAEDYDFTDTLKNNYYYFVNPNY